MSERQKAPERAAHRRQVFDPLWVYRALQIGAASKVVPIDKLSTVITLVLAFLFLKEEFTARSLIGCVLIGAGSLFMVL